MSAVFVGGRGQNVESEPGVTGCVCVSDRRWIACDGVNRAVAPVDCPAGDCVVPRVSCRQIQRVGRTCDYGTGARRRQCRCHVVDRQIHEIDDRSVDAVVNLNRDRIATVVPDRRRQ